MKPYRTVIEYDMSEEYPDLTFVAFTKQYLIIEMARKTKANG